MMATTRLGSSGFPRPTQLFTAKASDPFAVTVIDVRQVVGDLWRVAWTSSANGPFRVIRDGRQIDETFATQYVLHVGQGEAPIVEVLADPDAVPTFAKSSRLTLSWDASPNTKEYRIEKWDGFAWVTFDRMRETGEKSYIYRTATLADDTVYSFRVVPVGMNGNDGTPAVFRNLKMIRHPDPPNVAYAFNAGPGTVTITEVI